MAPPRSANFFRGLRWAVAFEACGFLVILAVLFLGPKLLEVLL